MYKQIRRLVHLLIILSGALSSFAQTYPTFGPEIKVTITGLTFDAMEPFVSPDGNTLFFNSLNSGGNTNLYYATRVNDSLFTFNGLIGGCYDPSPNHLDAVASMDSLHNFFWTSLRTIPNLHRGNYQSGNVTSISKVYGTCNISTAGWLIMDAGIDYQGQLLYYSNAYFGPTFTECVGVPCQTKMGIAQKVNDSTFDKISNSDVILQQINDTNYLIYAPQVTRDGLELYYTRLLKGSVNSEICVAVRSTTTDPFSTPMIVYANMGYLPEAPTLTSDKQRMYYHQKDGSGLYKIVLRKRNAVTGLTHTSNPERVLVFPNPTHDRIQWVLPNSWEPFSATLCNIMGKELLTVSTGNSMDLSNLMRGVYLLTIKQSGKTWTTNISKW